MRACACARRGRTELTGAGGGCGRVGVAPVRPTVRALARRSIARFRDRGPGECAHIHHTVRLQPKLHHPSCNCAYAYCCSVGNMCVYPFITKRPVRAYVFVLCVSVYVFACERPALQLSCYAHMSVCVCVLSIFLFRSRINIVHDFAPKKNKQHILSGSRHADNSNELQRHEYVPHNKRTR